MGAWPRFTRIWALTLEASAGLLVAPRCLVATELLSGELVRLPMLGPTGPLPFESGDGTLCLTYGGTFELSSFARLGWLPPTHLIDLQVEYRLLHNGDRELSYALHDALQHFGLKPKCTVSKDMRAQLASRAELSEDALCDRLLRYGAAHVADMAALFKAMQGSIDIEGALKRGFAMGDAGLIEAVGVPLDAALFDKFVLQREQLISGLVTQHDELNVFRGGSLNRAVLGEKLEAHFSDCPRTATGKVATDDGTLKVLARSHPSLSELGNLIKAVNHLSAPFAPQVVDGRSLAPLNPFGAVTGRCTPSSKLFVFSAPEWMRGFVRPPPGNAIAYIDWKAQEMGIAAALSKDPSLLAAYAEDDFYLGFARQAGEKLDRASPDEIAEIRRIYKVAAIAMLYGMGPQSLARKTGLSLIEAKALLGRHRERFHIFWSWVDARITEALFTRRLTSSMGWTIHLPPDCELARGPADRSASRRVTERTLRNFLMQANAADMMRLAWTFAHDAGVRICAPVHDGVLIEALLGDIEDAVLAMRNAMDRASRVVLEGRTLQTTVEMVARYPERYVLKSRASQQMWEFVRAHLEAA